MSSTATQVADSPSSQHQTFTCFPKLPVEIQDMIWDLSMTGQIREFRFVNPKHPENRLAYDGPEHLQVAEVRQSTQDSPTFRTSKASRARAMQWRTKHTFDLTMLLIWQRVEGWERLRWPDLTYPPHPIERPILHLDYDPAQDTFYIPSFYELYQLRDYIRLTQSMYEDPHRAIRSLALGGIFEYAMYNNGDIQPLTMCEIFFQGPFQAIKMGRISWLLTTFYRLEELIIVIPPIEDIGKIANSRRIPRHQRPRLPNPLAMQPHLETLQEDIQVFRRTLEANILAEGRDVDPPMEKDHSKWWDNPVVTCMTEKELFARHGTERKHGADNVAKIRKKFEMARSSMAPLQPNSPAEFRPDWKQLLGNIGELENVRALGYKI